MFNSQFQESESTSTSSGTSTPASAAPTPSYLPSTVSHAVSGLLRRFTSDSSHLTPSSGRQSPQSSIFSRENSNPRNNGVDGVFVPPRRPISPFQPPPLYPLNLKGYSKSTAQSAQLLSRAIAEEIRLLVPPRLQLCEDWNLVYSLEQDGVSLGTLYKKCDEYRGLRNGYVLVVRDGEGSASRPLPVFQHQSVFTDYTIFGIVIRCISDRCTSSFTTLLRKWRMFSLESFDSICTTALAITTSSSIGRYDQYAALNHISFSCKFISPKYLEQW